MVHKDKNRNANAEQKRETDNASRNFTSGDWTYRPDICLSKQMDKWVVSIKNKLRSVFDATSRFKYKINDIYIVILIINIIQ